MLLLTIVLGTPTEGWAQAQMWLGPNGECSAAGTLLGDWGGLRTSLAQQGIGFGLQEKTELWGNFAGGIKRGVAYDGLTTADLCIDLDKAVHWKGAKIFTFGFQIWGPGPTRNYVGSLQLISSIEARPSTKLYDLWFQQDLFNDKVSFRFGQGGADDEFMEADYAALFLNSSFTLPPTFTINLPSGGPVYPLAAPFARLLLHPGDEISLMSAVFTEDPAPPGTGDPQLRDRHGTAFRLDDHTLAISELSYSPAIMTDLKLPGTYKIGAWYATGPFTDERHDVLGRSLASPESNGIPQTHAGDYAIYGIINQTLWHKPTEEQRIGYFLQVMHAREDRNLSDWFIASGLNWKEPFPGRSDDEVGIGVTYAGISAVARRFSRDIVFYSGLGTPYAQGEPIIEATYRLRLTPWLEIQPDLQYVISPGAGIPTPESGTPLKNAVVAGVRMKVNF